MPLGNLRERSLEVGRRGDYLCLCTLENPSPLLPIYLPFGRKGRNISIWPEGGVERGRKRRRGREAEKGREGEKGRVHEHYKVTNMAPPSLASSLQRNEDAL